MTWRERARARLPGFLDAHGDLAPPWERFPTYERYTIGWRMGAGEDWLSLWSVHREQLPAGAEARIAMLRRHPPAPETWADWVEALVFGPRADSDGDDGEDTPPDLPRLRALGLVGSDVAYPTWRAQQGELAGPWEVGLTLADFADSFDDDMGYVDAFRLLALSAFDDRAHLERFLDPLAAPAAWRTWLAEQLGWP